MKIETKMIIFYVLYSVWLLIIVFLNPNTPWLNYFALGVSIFYFMFLKQPYDLFWFFLGALVPLTIALIASRGINIDLGIEILKLTPMWLLLVWGTTFVALRKFYTILNRRIG